MRLISLMLIVLVSRLFNQADTLCIDILDQYFSCRNLNPILIMKNSPFNSADWFKFSGSLNDSFYETVLANNTFDEAMKLFQHIAIENNQSCTSLACNCTRSNSLDISKAFSFYFLNTTYFPQVTDIISNATNKYQLLTPLEIYSITGQFYPLFDETIYHHLPTLTDYCLENDFTFNRIYNYKETHACYAQAYLKKTENLFDCDWSYLMFNNGKLNILNKNEVNHSVLETYYSCRLQPLLIEICPVEIQRFIALNNIDFKLINGNLSTYFDSLLAKANTTRSTLRFNKTQIYSYLGANSLKNSTQLCRLGAVTSCLNSSQLSIECAGRTGNYAAWANITFLLDNVHSFSLFVNLSSMPKYLDDSNRTVLMQPNSTNGTNSTTKWLETMTDGSSITYLVDYNSNLTIVFEENYLMSIYAPTQFYKDAAGILVNGCPTTSSSKSKRSTGYHYCENKCRKLSDIDLSSLHYLMETPRFDFKTCINRCKRIFE